MNTRTRHHRRFANRPARAIALVLAGAVALIACGPPPATAETVCDREQAAGCTRFDRAACIAGIQQVQAACGGNESAVQSFMNCGASASYTCNADGTITTQDCQAELLPLFTCVLGAAFGADAGQDASTPNP